MNATIAQRITAAVAGAAAAAGIVTGIALAAPAQANAAPSATTSCTTAMAPRQPSSGNLNPLTRAAQVTAISGGAGAREAVAVSCLGH